METSRPPRVTATCGARVPGCPASSWGSNGELSSGAPCTADERYRYPIITAPASMSGTSAPGPMRAPNRAKACCIVSTPIGCRSSP